MCGRFALSQTLADLVSLFDIDDVGHDLPAPSFNIAPTSRIHLIADAVPRGEEYELPRRRIESARWGLVPGFASSPTQGPPLFNARAETLIEKPTFRAAFSKRRSAIPATGYYEWHVAADGEKYPVFVHDPEGSLLVFAGVYEWWRDPNPQAPAPGAAPASPWLLSTTIVTTAASGPLAAVHERMPVFLQPELFDDWLDPTVEAEPELLEAVLDGSRELAEGLAAHRVSADVGAVSNDHAGLIAAV